MLMKSVFYELLPHILRVQGRLRRRRKQRLMIALFCCNASWSEEMRPLVIGKSAHPQDCRNVYLLPSDYETNTHAQSMGGLFNEWLRMVSKGMEGVETKILLLMATCCAYSTLLCLDHPCVELSH